MKKYFKFLTVLALIAPVTAACSNNSSNSSETSTAQSSTSSQSSTKKSSEDKPSKESSSDETSSSSSEVSSEESSSSSEDSQTSSNEEKSSNATSSSSQSDDSTSTMNLAQIKNGNFSSLEGNWEVVKAVGAHKDVTDTTDDALNVEPTGFASTNMTITADSISDTSANKTYPIQYTRNGDSLTATLTDEAANKASTNWSVSFYPAGSKNFTVDGEKQNPPTKDTIVIWTSNNNFSEVFQEK